MLLQVLCKAAGHATTLSCSGCWCRWSCGCFLCRVRLELRLSSTVPCQMKLPNTAGGTSSTADLQCSVLLQKMQVWPKSCGRPVRDWWSWLNWRIWRHFWNDPTPSCPFSILFKQILLCFREHLLCKFSFMYLCISSKILYFTNTNFCGRLTLPYFSCICTWIFI